MLNNEQALDISEFIHECSAFSDFDSIPLLGRNELRECSRKNFDTHAIFSCGSWIELIGREFYFSQAPSLKVRFGDELMYIVANIKNGKITDSPESYAYADGSGTLDEKCSCSQGLAGYGSSPYLSQKHYLRSR